MSYAEHLKELLRPLGAYRLEGTVNGAELESIGAVLDVRAEELEELGREMILNTATSTGLEAVESLLTRKPLAATLEWRRAAFRGACKKGAELALVLLAVRLDALTGVGQYVRMAVLMFFIGNEGLSVLENLGLMGVPYPRFLREALEALRDRGDGGAGE